MRVNALRILSAYRKHSAHDSRRPACRLPTLSIRVKICGLTNLRDARLAIEFGADALGFVHEPASPRYVGDEPPKWVAELDPLIPKVAVFGRVTRAVHRGLFDLVQAAEWDTLIHPSSHRFHVLRLRPGTRADDLVNQTVDAAALVLDAYREGVYGGTGETVDWDLAAEIVQRSARPVILAGGLTPENVAAAVRRVRPYAVDVSGGVEGPNKGFKDLERMKGFIDAARAA